MQKSTLLRCAILLVAAVFPVFMQAQFQQPTDEELKMTSDPKAPGAAAVYLDIDEQTNDPIHYRSFYAKIKVLTEKGKELATVELPYLAHTYKITNIKGRTIHPDGTVIPLAGKPEDLLSSKNGDRQFGRKVFTLPSVEVGSILEYSYEVHYDDNLFSSPTWEVQRNYFVHKAHYQFSPFKEFMPNSTGASSSYLTDSRGRTANSLIWWKKLPNGVDVQATGAGYYSLDVTDIPAAPDEEYMPPSESLLYKVSFYYSFARNAAEFWGTESNLWAKDVNRFAEPTKGIKSAVEKLVTSQDSDLDKAKKLYAAVEALDNSDYSRKKSETELKQLKLKEAKKAEDVWNQKGGNSEEIAMLYLSMLRAAGLTAYPAKIVDRNRATFDTAYMSLDQLDTTLVILNLQGKNTFLDPGEKLCPFGQLNWRHSQARGLGESAMGVGVPTTPEPFYKDNGTVRTGDLNIDAHGALTGSITIVMTGQEALRWRQYALRNDETELKKEFDSELEKLVPQGVEAHIDHFLALDKAEQNLIAVAKVNGTLGTPTAKRLILPELFFETRGHVLFASNEKRQTPVDIHYADAVSNTVVYHLAPGMTVEGTPREANAAWPGHASYAVNSKNSTGQIEIADVLARAFTQATPEEYQDLRSFYQKVAEADQGQIVLSIAQTAQGN